MDQTGLELRNRLFLFRVAYSPERAYYRAMMYLAALGAGLALALVCP